MPEYHRISHDDLLSLQETDSAAELDHVLTLVIADIQLFLMELHVQTQKLNVSKQVTLFWHLG